MLRDRASAAAAAASTSSVVHGSDSTARRARIVRRSGPRSAGGVVGLATACAARILGNAKAPGHEAEAGGDAALREAVPEQQLPFPPSRRDGGAEPRPAPQRAAPRPKAQRRGGVNEQIAQVVHR